ncbi:MAG: hypothetical protein KDC73_09000 [Ignavibacteriae bacterium]|nr:hypothetical protein [Ignavibacteriota bacterium]MCB9242154.1 hypothetical protein [Ignavibacteriales bacterium]
MGADILRGVRREEEKESAGEDNRGMTNDRKMKSQIKYYLTLVLLSLFFFSCSSRHKKLEVSYDDAKEILVNNESRFNEIARKFLNQKSLIDISRKYFSYEVVYDIVAKNGMFRITILNMSEIDFWKKNNINSIINEGKSFASFLDNNSIDINLFLNLKDFLFELEIFGIEKNTEGDIVKIDIMYSQGLLYLDKIGTKITGIPSTSIVKKITDNWYYFKIE